MARLQKMAEGNGLSPQDITLLKSDEKIYILQATMVLRPSCDMDVVRYNGPVGRKDRLVQANFDAMRAEAARRKLELNSNTATWIGDVVSELKKQPAEAWGLDEAKVVIPEQTVTLAASETCAGCRGQKFIPCDNCRAQGYLLCIPCQGRGEEHCYTCGGRGEDPQNPGQKCPTCFGTSWAPCRYCVKLGHPRGQVPCPLCLTKRGTTCGTCGGHGMFTEETKITCGAETEFRIVTGSLPSGFNRALERIGVVNLPKGHGDVETYIPSEEEVLDYKEKKKGAPLPAIFYRAHVPYADLRISFKGEPAMVSAFGKRCALLSVPAFLDDALELARENLARATRGNATLESATSARAIREALALHLDGKNNVNDFRRLYPIGLSAGAAKEIVANIKLAVSRATLMARGITAIGVAFACIGGLYANLRTPLHKHWVMELSSLHMMLADIGSVIFMAVLGWFFLAMITKLVLFKKFPKQKQLSMPKTGKIGMAMMGAIIAGGAVALYMAKPLWLLGILNHTP